MAVVISRCHLFVRYSLAGLPHLVFLVLLSLLVATSWADTPAAESAEHKTVLVLGDSISAGFGLPMQQGWVALLGKELQQNGNKVQVINASISGDTTQGGLNRLPALLKLHQPDLVVIELGGNDGLRGTPIKRIRRNLVGLIQRVQQAGSEVVLAGMQIPPNYGRKYTEAFRQLFAVLAEEHNTRLIPFLLEDAALQPDMMQADGIHPTAAAQPLLLQQALPVINAWLMADSDSTK